MSRTSRRMRRLSVATKIRKSVVRTSHLTSLSVVSSNTSTRVLRRLITTRARYPLGETMTSIKVKNARYYANSAFVKAREAGEDVRARADGIRNSGNYAPEGVVEYVEGWVNQGKTSAEAAVKTANSPKALIELYQRRAPQSQAERFVIEEAIQATIDAGLADLALAETW